MKHFVIILSLLLSAVTYSIAAGDHLIKTFYDSHLQTKHLFEQEGGVNAFCSFFGEFYEEQQENVKMTKCIRFKESQTLYCHGEIENFRNYTRKPKLERIENLIICYQNGTEFDASLLSYFTNLKNLFIGYSSFDRFVGKLPKLDHLKVINITETRLKIIKAEFFSELKAVQVIDLRSNQLNLIEKLNISSDHNHQRIQLYLHRNKWNCSQAKIIKWIVLKDPKIDFVDLKLLNCSDNKFNKRPLEMVMAYKNDLWKFCKEKENDLRNCTCHVSYLQYDEKIRSFKPVASVNCSSKGFYNFPKKLPPYTNALHIEHNQISSLNALCFKNSTYTTVYNIYLDYNRISDAKVLDNCLWFEQFHVLSLRGNQLENIPVFSFFNSFEKSHPLRIFLSENPWECSCQFAPRLLRLCRKYYRQISDLQDIKCHNKKNQKEIEGRHIMELTLLDVCEIKPKVNYYDIASIIFGILSVLVIVNFLIDYYRYKNYGKLPWIVLNTPLF